MINPEKRIADASFSPNLGSYSNNADNNGVLEQFVRESVFSGLKYGRRRTNGQVVMKIRKRVTIRDNKTQKKEKSIPSSVDPVATATSPVNGLYPVAVAEPFRKMSSTKKLSILSDLPLGDLSLDDGLCEVSAGQNDQQLKEQVSNFSIVVAAAHDSKLFVVM